LPQLPQLGGVQLQPDDKHQEDHAQLGEVENFIHIADKPKPPGANSDPCQQIAQHRANAETRGKRDRDDGGKQKQHPGKE